MAVLCMMVLMAAAASAASTDGPSGQQSAGTGSRQPGTGPGPEQQMADTHENNSVLTHNEAGNGGITPGQGPGQGKVNGTNPGQGNGPRVGNVTQPGQDQGVRIPVEEVIAQLDQKGYDVSEAKTLLQSGDPEAVKTWLDTFKKSNPGVVETIEGTGTKNKQGQKTGSESSNPGVPSEGTAQHADKNIFDIIISWFSNL